MTEPGRKEEYGPSDQVASASATDSDRVLDLAAQDKNDIESSSPTDFISHSVSEKELFEKSPQLQKTKKNYATTTTSGKSRTGSNIDTTKKPWYKNLHPLKLGGIPPVPKIRQVSREYNASFLSLVYFQWMAPLMSVGAQVQCNNMY